MLQQLQLVLALIRNNAQKVCLYVVIDHLSLIMYLSLIICHWSCVIDHMSFCVCVEHHDTGANSSVAMATTSNDSKLQTLCVYSDTSSDDETWLLYYHYILVLYACKWRATVMVASSENTMCENFTFNCIIIFITGNFLWNILSDNFHSFHITTKHISFSYTAPYMY